VSVRQSFSKEFKESIVQKVLSRGALSVREVCEREGVGKSTATNWVRACGKVSSEPRNRRGRMKWTAEAKLKAVVEAANLVESDLGAYLRREGLYSNQIAEWRAEIIGHFESKPKFARDERDDKIRDLEQEILRKDRALAEASALLILEKKVGLIWGKRDGGAK
jgi:transposase